MLDVLSAVHESESDSKELITATTPQLRLNKLCQHILVHFVKIGLASTNEVLVKVNDQTGEKFINDWEKLIFVCDLINSRTSQE